MARKPRIVLLLVFLACAGLIGFGLYLQEELGLEPCPMCILQRMAIIAIGTVALVGAAHGPKRWGIKVYAWLIVLFSLAGGGVAIRHSWIQHFPPAVGSCGADLDFLMSNLPLAQALPKIFAGTGECAEVKWKMFGLSIPELALLWFIVFAIVGLVIARHKRNVFR